MHLILLQKTFQSMDLSLRQQIDSTWLVQKAASQVSLLRLEAETVGEEELAQAAGQVLTYFETINEGRLDLDAEGVAVVRDFALIFKDALGDAAPGVRALDEKQVEAWESRYQALMAHMRPMIEEEADLAEPEDVGPGEEDEIALETSGAYAAGPVETDEDERVDDALDETYKPVHADSVDEDVAADYPDEEEFAPVADEAFPAEPEEIHEEAAKEEIADLDPSETTSAEDLPFYDPAEDVRARDVVIPDAEGRSARERMAMREPEPDLAARRQESEAPPSRVAPAGSDKEAPKAPVQLEEVERLKEKLLQLHEKQEMLSSRMSGILGGLKKAVRGEDGRQEPPPVEDLDVDELEDLIFIGRRKG